MLAAADTAASASSTNNPSFSSLLTRGEILTLVEKYGTKMLAAVVVFVVGMLVARRVGKLLQAALSKRDMDPPLRNLLVRFGKLAIMILAILIAILQLGFQVWPLIAGVSVLGVGVGLAMQGVLSNLVAGLTIIFVKKFRVGEYIEINSVQGVVDNIELFSTTLVHPDLSRVIVPNRKIVGEIIHNYGKVRQANLSVGVSYDTDLDQALELIRGILQRNPRVLKDPAPVVCTSTLADSSIVIAVKPWSALPDFGSMQAELNKAIVEGLRAAGIEIPFPQREVRVLQAAELKSVA
jgi:small conductance mechanosensitive channel